MLLMLCLPDKYGGIGLEYPNLNANIPRDDSVGHVTHFESMRPDLGWPGPRVAIEYDGGNHSDFGVRAVDARRIQDYQVLGWKAFPATFADARGQGAFNRFAWHIVEALDPTGERGIVDGMARLMRDAAFLERQARLLAVLLPKGSECTPNDPVSRG